MRRRTFLAVASTTTLAAFSGLGAGCERRPAADVQLEFWTLSLKPTFTDYIQGQIARFEADHPGVRVNWVDVPFATVERKLIAAAAADRAPDVVNMSDLMFARFAGAGAFAELSGLLPLDPAARYHPGALGVGELAGGLYALPWYLTTQAMIVNTSLLADGGLSADSVGKTWPALAEQAPGFAADTQRRLFTQPLGQDSQLPMMLLAEGLPPFKQDSSGRLRADLSRPEVVAFLQRWVDLYRAGLMPREAATNGFEHLIDVYQNERVAVLNTGANFLGRVAGVSRRVYDQTEVLPPITGSLGRAHIAVMPLCLSARSAHPKLAAELVWQLTSPEAQLEFCKLAPILPSTPASLDDPFFRGPTEKEVADGLEKIGRARAIIARALPDAVAFTPAMECWPTLRRIFEERIKGVLLAPPSEPLDLASELASINEAWDTAIDDMNNSRAALGAAPVGFDAIPTPRAIESSSTSLEVSATGSVP